MIKPPLRWHGGKTHLQHWIHEHAPADYTHRIHVFGGGGGELWNWPCENVAEVWNDVNHDLSTFFRVLRLEQRFESFARKVSVIPFSELEYNSACEILSTWERDKLDPVLRAACFFVRMRQSRQGLGKGFATPTKRIRRGMNENVSAWLSAVEGLPEVHERLKRVEIRDRDFRDLLPQYDQPQALFYCDPPYVPETRSTGGGDYDCEMDYQDHADLCTELAALSGKFMLSGYDNALYRAFAREHDWRCVTKQAANRASGKATKPLQTECIWMNY